jgi:hypothetical protein
VCSVITIVCITTIQSSGNTYVHSDLNLLLFLSKYSISNNNSQNKGVYKYVNLKRKLPLCNAHIEFNKICLKENTHYCGDWTNDKLCTHNMTLKYNISTKLQFTVHQLVQRWAMGWLAGVRFPAGAKFFSSSQRPGRFWDPTSLLSNGYWGRFPRR